MQMMAGCAHPSQPTAAAVAAALGNDEANLAATHLSLYKGVFSSKVQMASFFLDLPQRRAP